MARDHEQGTKVVPLFGKDEMNLIEFPYGPITSTSEKTLEVVHDVWDKKLKREVTRRMIITGSDAFGLPRPIDDNVLVGMKALTYESSFASRKVEFSRYQLCRTIGWQPDGRAYARLEDSFDRIAGTTLKFKDAWYDKGEKEYKSKTFHLIEEVDLCSRDRLDRKRAVTGNSAQKLCSFVWSDVIWKSFEDGFIKTLDMSLFRRIAQGHRREVPLRLFRILDKRFHFGPVAKFELRRLCIGTLGLSSNYSPAQMMRVLDRAVRWLIECDYLREWWHGGAGENVLVYFRRRTEECKRGKRSHSGPAMQQSAIDHLDAAVADNGVKQWIALQSEDYLSERENVALEAGFGSELERKIVIAERGKGIPIVGAGPVRRAFVRRFVETESAPDRKVLVGT